MGMGLFGCRQKTRRRAQWRVQTSSILIQTTTVTGSAAGKNSRIQTIMPNQKWYTVIHMYMHILSDYFLPGQFPYLFSNYALATTLDRLVPHIAPPHHIFHLSHLLLNNLIVGKNKLLTSILILFGVIIAL